MDRNEAAARFGQVLKDARSEAGLNQEQLAERIGTDQSSISAWERGRSIPELEIVLRIESAYGLKPGAITSVLGWLPCEPQIAIPPIVRTRVMPDATRERIEQLEETVRRFAAELEALQGPRQPATEASRAGGSDPAPSPRRRRRA